MALLSQLIWLYSLVVIARIILSWVQVPFDHPVAQVRRIAAQLTDPVLDPLRRVLPPIRIGGGGLDLAPMILLIALSLLRGAIS